MNARKVLPVLTLLVVASLFVTPLLAQEAIFQLAPGFTIRQAVDAQQQSQQYHIAGRTDASVFVLLASQDYTNAPAVTLTNDASNMAIAELRLAVSAMCLRLAPGSDTYTLSVSADHPQSPQGYALLLLQGDPNAMMCSNAMLESLAIGTGGAGAGNVIRIGSQVGSGSGDGDGSGTGNGGTSGTDGTTCLATSDALVKVSDSNATPIGAIDMGNSAPVLGTISGNDWLLVNSDGVAGLAPRSSVNLDGDCSNVSTFALDGDQAILFGDPVDLGAFGLGTGRLLDLNGDGILDTDSNGDGLLDVDLDRDGVLDVDTNGDGILDADLDGDGVLDTNGLRIDTDFNDSGLNADVNRSGGNLFGANVDTNGDGIVDVDLDGDGVIDDVNGDGILDADLNGDGILDIDANGDGIIDVDANTNDGLDVIANADTNSGNTGTGGVDVNLNPQNNNAPDLSADLNTNDNSTDASVDLQGAGSGDTGLCVNALGIAIAC
jgi:hypothetical protein